MPVSNSSNPVGCRNANASTDPVSPCNGCQSGKVTSARCNGTTSSTDNTTMGLYGVPMSPPPDAPPPRDRLRAVRLRRNAHEHPGSFHRLAELDSREVRRDPDSHRGLGQ